MPNRILDAVTKFRNQLKDVPDEKRQALELAATLSPSEWAFFGDKSSLALAEGKITAEEAETLHRLHSHFSVATLEERMVFMKIMAELR